MFSSIRGFLSHILKYYRRNDRHWLRVSKLLYPDIFGYLHRSIEQRLFAAETVVRITWLADLLLLFSLGWHWDGSVPFLYGSSRSSRNNSIIKKWDARRARYCTNNRISRACNARKEIIGHNGQIKNPYDYWRTNGKRSRFSPNCCVLIYCPSGTEVTDDLALLFFVL